MFLKNNAKDEQGNPKDLPLKSHAGLSFVCPSGVFAIWDSAGEELLKVHGTPESQDTRPPKFQKGINIGGDGGAIEFTIMEASKEDWDKDGRKLAQVSRFKIKGDMIPRKMLIQRAREYGIPNDRVMDYLTDEDIDRTVIADEINKLPVPEHIRYPENIEQDIPTTANGSNIGPKIPVEEENESRKKIKAKLDALKVEYDGRAGTDTLLELLINKTTPDENKTDN